MDTKRQHQIPRMKILKMFCVAVVIPISFMCFYMRTQQQQSSIVAGCQLIVPTSNQTPAARLYKKVVPSRSRILLMTYLRSGSTLTGDILQASDQVFYLFEPLLSLYEFWPTSGAPIMFFEEKPVIYSRSHYRAAAVRTVDSILNCSFINVDLKTLSQMHMHESTTTKPFWGCVKYSSGVLGIRSCLHLIEDACTARRATIQKVVRLPLKDITPFMKIYPDLKIIHLIRDPRATITSQYSRLHYFKMAAFREYTKDFCARVVNDLKEVNTLATTYPKRVKLLRYETLAEDPLYTTKEMYNFLNIPFTDYVRERVYNMTLAGHRESGCLLCTVKANSTVTARSWRKRVDVNMAILIDTICADVMNTVGYLPIQSSRHLSDTNIPLVAKHVKFAGMNI